MHFRMIFIILFCLCKLSYADSLNTQLSSDKIAYGDAVTITFVLDSTGRHKSPDFSALEKDFHILSTNYGNSISMVNGAVSTKAFWRLMLEPRKAGTFTIPEINFGNVKSEARKLTVEDSAGPAPIGTGNAPAFVQAEISNKSPYIQGQTIYTFKLFYQTQLDNPRIEMPQLKDATFIPLGGDNQYQTTVKGEPYIVLEKNFAIFSQKPGDVFIPPTYFRAVSYDNSPVSAYDPFAINAPKPVALGTPPFTLHVQKIPDNYQGSTWLPAKNISVTEKWSTDSSHWEAGNPVTRTIIVVADGLRSDQIPDITIDKMTDVNVYVDPPKRNNNLESKTVTGVLEQKVTYIPNSSSSFTIPAIKLHWWNTETNANTVSELNAKTVQVIGKINNTATPILNTPVAAPVIKNVAPINNPAVKSAPFYLTIWFWIAVFLFVSWIITIGLLWNKRSVKSVKQNDKKMTELNDKDFKQACKQGNAIAAQQFLLAWARNRYSDMPMNLEKISEIVHDINLKDAIKNLEQTIYAKTSTKWDGNALLSAYQKMKKPKRFYWNMAKEKNRDLLPPLHPRDN